MRPGQPIHRHVALRLAVNLEDTARAAARRWIEQLPDQAPLIGRGRAERTIDTHGADPLRAALSREWFARVFEDEALRQLGRHHPEKAVTQTETEHVAECFRTGVAYRIHGPDGAVVLNPDSPVTTPGQTNTYPEQDETTNQQTWMRAELEALATRQDLRRHEEEQIVAADWAQLSPEQRTAFAAYWHREHDTTGPTTHPIIGSLTPTQAPEQAKPEQAPLTYTATTTGHQVPVTGPPAKAAAEVFAKPPPTLAETTAARGLSAASFPHQKPASISATGQVRTDPLSRAKDDGARDRSYTDRYPHSTHGPEL